MTDTPDRLLRTRQCADVLDVSTAFIRGEIEDGRLRAAVSIRRPSGRTLYRIAVSDFRAYCATWSPSALSRIA